ncbi:MAG: hypothetical protein WBX25_27220 [Rhodomicrobium sp.]
MTWLADALAVLAIVGGLWAFEVAYAARKRRKYREAAQAHLSGLTAIVQQPTAFISIVVLVTGQCVCGSWLERAATYRRASG